MKIAVTYDNGNIFQHFGRTESFKVYEVEDGNVVSSEVIGSNGIGHGALAGLLAEQGIDVLICGGIGGGAQAALDEAGVELCSGAEGDADQAVEAYLKGVLPEEQKLKYEIAQELGILDKVLESGWKSLSAKETGRIGGLLASKRKEEKDM